MKLFEYDRDTRKAFVSVWLFLLPCLTLCLEIVLVLATAGFALRVYDWIAP